VLPQRLLSWTLIHLLTVGRHLLELKSKSILKQTFIQNGKLSSIPFD
jgi:hypothetical protein